MIKRFTLFVLAGVAGLLVVMAVAGAVFLFTPFGRGRTEPGSDAGAERTSEQEIPESEREIPDEEIAEAEGREQSDEPPDNSLTILLAGRKGRLTDSMLLLHIDGPDEVARILTIPRDLWYGGYKINERYYHRGGEAMMKAVGDLTGYEPDHFAVVNMDGFVEIIDHLGGIEITLDEPLRDDVIRVPEGQGPLDYDAGTHTVSGEEALLIARSRATTDDFDRAQRQTRIIEGVQDRLSELAFGDIPALYRIGRTVYEYVDTDVSIARAVGYFLDYGIIDEFERSGLTVDNVLENSHSAYLPDDEVAYRSEWPEDMEELVRRRDPETVEAERQGYGGNKAARLAWLTRRDEDDLEAAWQELRASYQSDEDDTEDEDDTAGEASTE
ncbi:MAG: LCP family protein, partial [Spirochaetales bacterium]